MSDPETPPPSPVKVELKPCPNPWCNSHKTTDCEIRRIELPILMPSKRCEWAVACPVCPIQTPWLATESEAITAWNTRASLPAPVKVEEAQSSHEFHQRRGMLADAILECLHLYREFMADDDYDSQRCLDKVFARLTRVEDVAKFVERPSASLPAPVMSEGEEEEFHKIGMDEGYSNAVQEIDLLTGGDGEYRYCLGGPSDRHCPDADTMKRNIVERFESLQRDLAAALERERVKDEALKQWIARAALSATKGEG